MGQMTINTNLNKKALFFFQIVLTALLNCRSQITFCILFCAKCKINFNERIIPNPPYLMRNLHVFYYLSFRIYKNPWPLRIKIFPFTLLIFLVQCCPFIWLWWRLKTPNQHFSKSIFIKINLYRQLGDN